jgi:hypothetical protein
MSNVDCFVCFRSANKTVNIGHRTQDTERRQTKQSTLDIEHKTQNEDKQNSQHWIRSVSCVLCPMFIVLFVFVLCLVFYVQCLLFCLSSFCVLCPMSNVDCFLFLITMCCLSFELRILITPLVSSNSFYTTINTLQNCGLRYFFTSLQFLSNILAYYRNIESCVLCPMFIVLFVFVLCLVFYVQC